MKKTVSIALTTLAIAVFATSAKARPATNEGQRQIASKIHNVQGSLVSIKKQAEITNELLERIAVALEAISNKGHSNNGNHYGNDKEK